MASLRWLNGVQSKSPKSRVQSPLRKGKVILTLDLGRWTCDVCYFGFAMA